MARAERRRTKEQEVEIKEILKKWKAGELSNEEAATQMANPDGVFGDTIAEWKRVFERAGRGD